MIIDIHTHIFPPSIAEKALRKLSRLGDSLPFTDGTLDGLRSSMERASVSLSVLLPVATDSRQVEGINDFAARLNETYEGKEILSFASIHPGCANARKELSRIKSLGFPGIKVHPAYQDTDLDDIRYLRIFERAAELGLFVITHAGLDIGFPGVVRCSPQMARRAIDAVGDFPILLAHMGGWKNWDDVPECLADTKAYIDTAFSIGFRQPLRREEPEVRLMETGQAMDILRAFGADRILFGSDSPWSSQKTSVEAVQALPIPEDDKEKILGKNARKILHLLPKAVFLGTRISSS